jgi:fatty acid desaturase
VTRADGTKDARLIWAVAIATALCYAIGYPLALGAGVAFGWVLVTLGGPLLIALGVLVIRRVHR